MTKIKRIPTILGLLVLIFGLITGLFLIRQKNIWQSQASSDIAPKQATVTNINAGGFTVSWITDSQTSGFVKYGLNNDHLDSTAVDERDQLSGKTGKFLTHHVTLKGLNANTQYFFQIGSGTNIFTNNGQSFQQTTAQSSATTPPANDVAYGSVLDQNKNPAEGVIVYFSIGNTIPQSALTKSSGSWVIPLNLAYASDLSGYSPYDRQASIEEIFVQGGSKGTATAVTLTKNDSPVSPITLGQSFDFRAATTPQENEPPASNPAGESKFSLPEATDATDVASLTILNPDEGEKIQNSLPEIFGNGPAGETLTLTLQSANQYSGSVKIDSAGNWKWTPPGNLEPGEHIISVLLANGKKISHAFTVLAAGETDLPAFTATPSATLAPTHAPTPTVTPPVRTSMPSTQSGVPSSGYLTPTFFVSIMGLVLISLGLFTKVLLRKI